MFLVPAGRNSTNTPLHWQTMGPFFPSISKHFQGQFAFVFHVLQPRSYRLKVLMVLPKERMPCRKVILG